MSVVYSKLRMIICSSSGTLFIEDFVKRRPFTIQELNDLEVVIACPYVPSEEEYVISLKSAGFMNIQTVDLRYG